MQELLKLRIIKFGELCLPSQRLSKICTYIGDNKESNYVVWCSLNYLSAVNCLNCFENELGRTKEIWKRGAQLSTVAFLKLCVLNNYPYIQQTYFSLV
jgi:hypothetical protein